MRLTLILTLIAMLTAACSGLAQDTQPASQPAVLFDQFGQSAVVDFPEKVRSEQELRDDVQRDEAYYNSLTPPARDRWGGLPGSREQLGLTATGFFHVETAAGRQVLVDPDGNLYFMLATGGVFPYHDFLDTAGREQQFERLPPRSGKFRQAWRGSVVSFAIANAIRKYGRYNSEQWKDRMIERLRKWGFNAQSSYGRPPGNSERLCYPACVVIQEIRGLDGENQIAHFPDPFDPAVHDKLDADLKEYLPTYVDRADILGYFIQNEPDFAFIPTTVPGLTGDRPAKRELVGMLREKYQTIDHFNAAWKMEAKSFDDLLEPICPVTTEAGRDVVAFQEHFLDAYYRMVTQAVRQYDPNHLILGSRRRTRDARTDLVNRVAGRYVDVLSFNYYTFHFEKDFLIRAHEQSGGRPIILSEWNYDTDEQGLRNTLRQVKTQEERGLAYRNYVEQAASLPFVVGVQWWCTLDHQGSQWNTGLVNIADRPYKDFLKHAMETNYSIYDVLLSRREPFEFDHPLFKRNARPTKVAEVPHCLPGHKVDGVQAPWPDRPSYRITAANMVMGTDAGDHQADFWLCWDKTHLYLYIDVQDPTPRNNPSYGRGIWAGDAVEVFLSGQDVGQPGGLQFGDRQVLISAKAQETPDYYWYNSPKQFPIQAVVRANPDGQGWTLEAGIPFEAFNFTPQAGKEFMFDVGFDDTDANLTSRLRQFMWNGTEKNSTQRNHWGRARLSP
ncbi:MAG: hypothetical protein GXY33_03105 [Phycisphaerae bacterium]|mgnify:CR=1 FL=1|nr:hypothetical protein [Phycisphaerae bacterium]